MSACRCGVPAGLRARVWLGALRLGAVTERDYNYLAALQREVGRVHLATDDMVRRDAANLILHRKAGLRVWQRDSITPWAMTVSFRAETRGPSLPI